MGSINYNDAEWAESVGHGPLDVIEDHELLVLHQHWVWANHSRRCFENEVRSGARFDPLVRKGPFAMLMWYALLYALIEGFSKRRIALRGPFNRDLRLVREHLRDCRNAVWHVGDYYDERLLPIMELRDSAHVITRVHTGFGRLLLQTMQARGASNPHAD
jgi:hypothetical protein